MKLEDTVVIMFHGGTYGKYLHWILNNFTEKGLKSDLVFKGNQSGSSHEYTINGINNPPWNVCDNINWNDYHGGLPFYALHIVEGTDDWEAYFDTWMEVDKISRSVNKVILINSTSDYNLLALNNGFEKTFTDKKEFFQRMNRFNDFKVDINDIPSIRELLSYKLFHLEWRHSIEYKYNNVLAINLIDILYNIEETVLKIITFLNTELTVSLESILENHSKMLSLQKHLNKDKYIARYLDCFDKDIPCSLPKDCTIIDEAYIQHYLRDHFHLEIRCDGLKIFPDTAKKLKALTYPEEELQRG